MIRKYFKKKSKVDETVVGKPVDYITLIRSVGKIDNGENRVEMTVSCKDAEYIPKVAGAGTIVVKEGKEYQKMHNGILVENGGYFGDWMSEIITRLKGHHEPQEEKVFHELLKRLDSTATMIELGSFWSYYSIWFNQVVKNPTNICCEPDEINIELGKRNAFVNHAKNIKFIHSAAGKDDGKIIKFQPEFPDRSVVKVPIRTVDSIFSSSKLKKIDVLHMDIQGHELNALKGAKDTITKGLVRFVLISTHHYFISGDPAIHEKCIKFIHDNGGTIIVEHAIHESFSGDGLILASFDNKDKNFKIEVSMNRMSNSLFRSYNLDLEVLAKGYEELARTK